MQESLLKKLIYRSKKRGCKESDLLLDAYSDAQLPQKSMDDLLIYERLLDEQDADIFAWVAGKKETPAIYESLIFEISQFRLKNNLK